MGKSRQQWEDRIRTRLGDHGILERMAPGNILTGLETALTQLGRDFPVRLEETFSGDGSAQTVTLASWVDRLSTIVEVEYPAGNIPPDLLEAHEYRIAPGSSILTFLELTPAAGTDNIVVRYEHPGYPFPDDTHGPNATDLVPDVMFPGVASLAASVAARDKALEFAKKQSASLAGQNFDLDPEPLFSAARELRQAYDTLVKGVPASEDAPQPAAYASRGVEREASERSLFHRPGW